MSQRLKVLYHEFFRGRRSSAGSHLIALLLWSCLLRVSLQSSQRILLYIVDRWELGKIAVRVGELQGPKPEKAREPKRSAEMPGE